MINNAIRLIQGKSRQEKIKTVTLYWLNNNWQSRGLVHEFVRDCYVPGMMETIEPWVTEHEVDKALSDLEDEGLAESKESLMHPAVLDVTDIFWRKL